MYVTPGYHGPSISPPYFIFHCGLTYIVASNQEDEPVESVGGGFTITEAQKQELYDAIGMFIH